MRIVPIGETFLSACLIMAVPMPGEAQDLHVSKDAQLQELSTLAQPRQQTGIDTAQLASAHRQRAESVQEKTNGLWQSWVVAICKGCTDTPSYRKTIDDDAVRTRSNVGVNMDRITAGPKRSAVKLEAAKLEAVRPEASRQVAAGRYTNLSSETIAQIRLGAE